MKVICKICGIEFEALKSTAKYCSNNCRNKMRRDKYADRKEQGLNPYKSIPLMKKCLLCGKEFTPKTGAANQRTCCYDCMPEGTQLLRSEFLNILRQQRGGKCERCGYDKYLGALEFHHLDPSKKEFTIGNRDFKLQDCIEESKKCILICSNCHKELHANLWNIIEREEVNLDTD